MGFRARVKCGIWLKYPKESLFMLAFWCFFTVASYMLLMKVHFFAAGLGLSVKSGQRE